jgi:hypothetical protein
LHQQAEKAQAVFLGERGEDSYGIGVIHISIILEIWMYCKAAEFIRLDDGCELHTFTT